MSSKSSYGSALAGPEDARVSQRYLPSDRSLPKQRAVGALATGPRRIPSESRDALSSAQSARLPAGLMTTGNLARPPSPVRRRPSRRPEGIAHRPRPNVSARERRHRRPKHWLCSGGEFVGPHAREGRGELFPTCECLVAADYAPAAISHHDAPFQRAVSTRASRGVGYV